MKTKTKRIFLGGGGDAEDSKLIDEQFVKSIDPSKPTIYVPNAMPSEGYQSCLDWFRPTMKALGIATIEMWEDLLPHRPINDISGIYIGGGDTVKLLDEIRTAGFDQYLSQVAQSGIPLYGGSAGAIVFGEDIRTAPEASHLTPGDAKGLRILVGHSIMCHYEQQDETQVRTLQKTIGMPIIAIPEKAGACIEGKTLTNYGSVPLYIFRDNEETGLDTGESLELE